MTANAAVLERLFQTIKSRQGGDPDSSYTAKLLAKGRGAIACKLGEETTETIVAALDETDAHVTSESADLLYHLLVLWADCGVEPEQVWQELARREGTSGIEEKNARANQDED